MLITHVGPIREHLAFRLSDQQEERAATRAASCLPWRAMAISSRSCALSREWCYSHGNFLESRLLKNIIAPRRQHWKNKPPAPSNEVFFDFRYYYHIDFQDQVFEHIMFIAENL